MSEFVFSKMHGAGNDFIVTDDKCSNIKFNPEFIKRICDRRRGIGADGLIIISDPVQKGNALSDFRMIYYNCDGGLAEMCGNGLRCAAYYTGKYLEPSSRRIVFKTDAGILETHLLEDKNIQIEIPLISNPERIELENQEYFKVNTGVPHLVMIVEDVYLVDVEKTGMYLRNHERFYPEGVNVNFVSISGDSRPVKIRTYERGVEGETSACGTGITASALVLAEFYKYTSPVIFHTRDNDTIAIDFCYNENIVGAYSKILLTGPVEEVFRGKYFDDKLTVKN